MSIKKVKFKNFTVFNDIEADVSSGVNVIIGENGTGKTHLMKGIYMISRPKLEHGKSFDAVREYFQSTNDEVIRSDEMDCALIYTEYDEMGIRCRIFNNDSVEIKKMNSSKDLVGDNVFIPAKDMLTHSKGFVSLYDERYMPFDKSYKDIISKSMLTNLKKTPELGKVILQKLEELIGGKVVIENEVFYIQKGNGDLVSFSLEAEGIKKIAIIWQLIMNGSIFKGSVLFWDEPEANINPKLLKDVAEILLELSRNGVQVFVASHNYIFAKYMEVLMKDTDNVTFHSLYKTEDGVKCETNRNFRDLKHNSIVSSFDKLLDQVFELNLGE
ncbi:MAG: ATP-binding protein [Eubacteriales bacterium]